MSDEPPPFEEPWEARTFGMAVTLTEQLGVGWDGLRPHLTAAIAARPDAPYYECLLDAVEALAQANHPNSLR